jgi:hypothetical protein
MKTVLILGGAASLLYYLTSPTSPIAALRTPTLGATRVNTTSVPGAQPAVSALPADPFRTLSARRTTRASAYAP